MLDVTELSNYNSSFAVDGKQLLFMTVSESYLTDHTIAMFSGWYFFIQIVCHFVIS